MIGYSYFLIVLIYTILVTSLYYLNTFLCCRREGYNSISIYYRKLDIIYYIKILKENKITYIDRINKYIDLQTTEIIYYGTYIHTIIISSVISNIVNNISNDIAFTIIIFAILYIMLHPIINILAFINKKITKQTAIDIKYMKSILLEIEKYNLS